MFFVAWKNLIHDRTRLAITILGVSFAVILIFFDLGAYLGFVTNASNLIDHSEADIWITSQHNINFDSARPLPERKLYKAREVEGVLWAEPVVMTWGLMKLKSGATESVQIIGFDPENGIGGPWRMKEGSLKALKVSSNTIIVDESALRRLGGLELGDKVEIFEHQVEVVGISQEVKSFTTYPIVFTKYENAKKFSRIIKDDQTTFILVKVAPGFSVEKVLKKLQRISGVDVYTKEGFSWKTRRYWIVQTGMGIGFGLTALLGFIVGTIIVGQTVYASTMEHLREFGTLKAIGATNLDLYKIIVHQALINACFGFAFGFGITLGAKGLYEAAGVNMVLPVGLKVFMFFLTILMCLTSSIISIRKATTIDPVIVFRA